VLELCHETAVTRSQRPAIVTVNDVVRRHRQKRLDGQHHSFVHDEPLTIIEIRHRRLFVQSAADAVPVEIANGAESISASVRFDDFADVAESVACLSGLHRVALRTVCRVQEASSDRRDRPDGNTDAGVGEISIELRRHVDVDEISLAKMSIQGGNAVRRLVVETDTGRSRKVVRHARSRPRAVAPKGFTTNRIEFAGGDARSDRLHHRVSRFRDDATRPGEAFEIFVAVNRHYEILRCPLGAPDIPAGLLGSSEQCAVTHLWLDSSPMADGQTTYYQTLGVAEAASKEDIKRRFDDLQFDLAPEQHVDASPDVLKENQDRLARVTMAYSVLSDFAERANYDEVLRQQRQPARNAALEKVARRPGPNQCEICGHEPAVAIVLRRGVGMLLMRRRFTLRLTACRDCGMKRFRDMQNATMTQGWWGIISFFTNFYYIAENHKAYRQLRKLDAPTMPGGTFTTARSTPSQPGKPLHKRLGIYVCVAALVVAGYYIAHEFHSNPNTLNGLSHSYVVGGCVAGSANEIAGMVSCTSAHKGKILAIVSAIDKCPTTTTNYFKERAEDLQPGMYVCLYQATP
jgi:DnaJ domain